MQKLLFRSHRTWLSDNDLILLDVFFDGIVPFRLLRREGFQPQWNLKYSHGLDDEQLNCQLLWLCEHGVLRMDTRYNRDWYQFTPNGGELWSQERCPVWDRFCWVRCREASRGRTLMSVVTVSPQIRDDYIRLGVLDPIRIRRKTISNHDLLPWRTFSRLHVGLVTYREFAQWTPEECLANWDREREMRALEEKERSWWINVSQLQRFTPDTV